MITVHVSGVKELQSKLNRIQRGIRNPGRPLKESEDILNREVNTNWGKEGGLFGGWKPLAASTVRDRERLGFPGRRPILQRTGKLKESTRSGIQGNILTIENTDEKFKYHQKGTKRIPQRKILSLRRESVNAITRKFISWISDILK